MVNLRGCGKLVKLDRMRKIGPALRVYYFTLFAALGVQMPFLPPWLEDQGFSGVKLGFL
jgi:hypothetical protein